MASDMKTVTMKFLSALFANDYHSKLMISKISRTPEKYTYFAT